MTLAVASRPAALTGRPKPRVAPPTPARTRLDLFMESCKELDIEVFPWQETVARYLYAVGPDDQWLYPDVVDVVGRQNGKTEILVPHVVTRLKMGRRVMHTAQDRALPREVFRRVTNWAYQHRDQLASKPRLANGQEEISMRNGGRYRIVAPTDSGARGPSNDDLLVDEVREQDDYGFMAAAEPTLTASSNPQSFFLSNAGDESSLVLNDLRRRAAEDRSLAYLEWSAGTDRAADDRKGWAEANPSIGHLPGILPYLERKYESYRLAGQLSVFETEHLCRWVVSVRERLVDGYDWSIGEEPELEESVRPFMGISMDPSGKRASAAVAWTRPDGSLGLRLVFDVPGNPIDTDRLGKDLRDKARALNVQKVGFDPLTDAVLAKFFTKPEPIAGAKYANASARFVAAIEAHKVRWQDASQVGDDLTWTARKPHDESGSFQAVRADDNHPITAAHAAIRALWLASIPDPISTYNDRGLVTV